MDTASVLGVRLKIARAAEHHAQLVAAMRAYNESNPYRIVVRESPESERREHVVTRVEPLPAGLPLMVGDIVHNLRVALDHLIWQLIVANGGQPMLLRPAFPIWGSEAACKDGWPGFARGISDKALRLLKTLKPYRNGNDALWLLHQLDIVDKHRLHLTVLARQRTVILDMSKGMREAIAEIPVMEENRREAWIESIQPLPVGLNAAEPEIMREGAVLFASPTGDTTYDDARFAIELGIDEPGIAEGEPLDPMLEQLTTMVTGIVDAFEPLLAGD